jgi:hypothetical protein
MLYFLRINLCFRLDFLEIQLEGENCTPKAFWGVLFGGIFLPFYYFILFLLFLHLFTCIHSKYTVIPPVLLFLLSIALVICDLLCFQMNFRLDFSISVMNVSGTFVGSGEGGIASLCSLISRGNLKLR